MRCLVCGGDYRRVQAHQRYCGVECRRTAEFGLRKACRRYRQQAWRVEPARKNAQRKTDSLQALDPDAPYLNADCWAHHRGLERAYWGKYEQMKSELGDRPLSRTQEEAIEFCERLELTLTKAIEAGFSPYQVATAAISAGIVIHRETRSDEYCVEFLRSLADEIEKGEDARLLWN